jgi:hypothetical protein
MEPSRPAAAPTALSGVLHSLIDAQTKNFTAYLDILHQECVALENDDGDKLDQYRLLEAAGREKIVETERSLRGLEGDLAGKIEGTEAQAGLTDGRGRLEELRREAVAANEAAQRLFRIKMKEVKSELAVLSATLRRLGGGQAQAGSDPLFIDLYS